MEKYDAIIVLGGGVSDDGTIPTNAERRVRLGVEKLLSGLSPVIIMSSGWSYLLDRPPKITEAQAMKQYAIRFGAPIDTILLEDESRDTAGNAYFTKIRILEPRNWYNILVVTSDYHAQRSEYLFKKILGPKYKITMATALSEPEMRKERDSREAKSFAVAKKWLNPIAGGNDVAIWNLMSTKHPGYAKNSEVSKEELRERLYE